MLTNITPESAQKGCKISRLPRLRWHGFAVWVVGLGGAGLLIAEEAGGVFGLSRDSDGVMYLALAIWLILFIGSALFYDWYQDRNFKND